MEKYAVQDIDLLGGLRDEEHNLMLEVSRHMSGYKTAEDNQKFDSLQNRLQSVRDKITEMDLKKMSTPEV